MIIQTYKNDVKPGFNTPCNTLIYKTAMSIRLVFAKVKRHNSIVHDQNNKH